MGMDLTCMDLEDFLAVFTLGDISQPCRSPEQEHRTRNSQTTGIQAKTGAGYVILYQ